MKCKCIFYVTKTSLVLATRRIPITEQFRWQKLSFSWGEFLRRPFCPTFIWKLSAEVKPPGQRYDSSIKHLAACSTAGPASWRVSAVIAAGPLRAGEQMRYLSEPPAAGQSATHSHTRACTLPAPPKHKSLYELWKPSTIILQRNWQISLSISQVRLPVLPLNSWTLKWSSSVCNEGWGMIQEGETSIWGEGGDEISQA